MFVVYSDTAVYRVDLDLGKRFQLESEADHFAMTLRRSGHMAWVESDLRRERDEYGL